MAPLFLGRLDAEPEQRCVGVSPSPIGRRSRMRWLLGRAGGRRGARAADKRRACLARGGVAVTDARVVGGEPISAIEQELQNTSCTGFVISTLPGERSAWLRMGLPQKVAATFDGIVRHVEAPPEWAGP